MAIAAFTPPAHAVSPARSLLTAEVGMEDRRTTIVLHGEGDLSATPVLSEVLSRVIAEEQGDVIVDVSGMVFSDTAAIRTLAIGHRLLERRDRTMTFRSPSRLTARMLLLFGLTGAIEHAGP